LSVQQRFRKFLNAWLSLYRTCPSPVPTENPIQRFSPNVTLLHCAQNLQQYQFAGDRARAGDGTRRRRLENTPRRRDVVQKAQLPRCRCTCSAAENKRACQSHADAGMLLHTCLVPATPGQALTDAIATTIYDGLCGSYCGNARHFRRPGT
jgi:hypothetical protein